MSEYETLRDALRELARDWKRLAYREVFLDRFQALAFDRWSDAGFSAFAHACQKTADERWEPGLDYQVGYRWSGRDVHRSLEQIEKLANRGSELLCGLRLLVRHGYGLPEDFRLVSAFETQLTFLPEDWFGTIDNDVWWRLVHEFGQRFPTTDLSASQGWWNLPNNLPVSQLDELVHQITTVTDDVSFPAHPYYSTLNHNVFKSSVAFIDIILGEAPVSQVKVWDGDQIIYLPPEEIKPIWNGNQLWFDGQLIKEFIKPANNQRHVLASFEELNWPSTMDDPLPGKKDLDTRKRVKDTVRGLNTDHVVEGVLCFSERNNGEAFAWEWVQ